MEYLRRYSIYFKPTHRLITQSKIKAVTYIPQILTLPTWLEKPGKNAVLSLNSLAHVLCTSMLCFNIWHECFPVSPQGQMHPGQQIKRTESHFLLLFEITFTIRATTAVRILFLYLSALFFFRDPHWKSFCNGLEQSVDFRSAYLPSVLCLGTNNRFFFLACCCLDDVWLCTLVHGFWSCNDSAKMVKHAFLSQYAPFWVSFVCFFALLSFGEYCFHVISLKLFWCWWKF